MAYVSTYGHTGTTRVGSLAVVAGVHAGLGALLILGLNVDVIPIPESGPLVAFTREAPKPKPPEKTPDPKPRTEQPKSVTYVPPTTLDLTVTPTKTPEIPVQWLDDVILVPDGKLVIEPNETMPPARKFRPKSAAPRGDRAGWVTTDDYPSRDLREGNTGKVLYEVSVGTNGRVTDCRVTGSSGHPGLDKATCDKLTHRARFDPATDGNGAKVEGSYSGSVLWRIPE